MFEMETIGTAGAGVGGAAGSMARGAALWAHALSSKAAQAAAEKRFSLLFMQSATERRTIRRRIRDIGNAMCKLKGKLPLGPTAVRCFARGAGAAR
ncbi:hypothetical protein WKR88_14125 [Trinickia caryophylli]|uniref:hypothetical protein n=1 Tax=Trinickia caryophylli TaxID=28094 RepID=UPI001304A89A|nr:hypothetical protein [Trinickia caryophylli]WQE14820.1 hypothetical protein U0034_19870 [Trinickia caryophylli]GLU35023.1 hypothetical protein Busp01_48650 [Trinickia caryophylli]